MTKCRKVFCLLLACLMLLSGCGSSTQAYNAYVQAVLDCTYKGEIEPYHSMTEVYDKEADGLYRQETQYITELICHQMSVKYDCLSVNNQRAYRKLAEKLQNKLSYKVESVVEIGDAYQVTITVEPTNFWDICIDDVEQLYKAQFSERFGRAEGQEEKLRVIEGVWGARVLEILNSHIDEAGYQEPVTMQFTIRTDEQGIYKVRSKDWLDLDDVMLDIAANN